MKTIALFVLCIASVFGRPNYGTPDIRVIQTPAPYAAPIVKMNNYEAPIVRTNNYEAPLLKTETYGGYGATRSFIPITKSLLRTDNYGTYTMDVLGGDGSSHIESGSLKNIGSSQGPVGVKQGSFAWTSPEGQNFRVDYVADELGFRPVGSHLPRPPPIPEEIQKSLLIPRIPEYNTNTYSAPSTFIRSSLY